MTPEGQVVATISAILGATFLMYRHLDTKIDNLGTKIDNLDTKIDNLDTANLSGKIDGVRDASQAAHSNILQTQLHIPRSSTQ